jgi:hypothetical protein
MCFPVRTMFTVPTISGKPDVEVTALIWRHSLFHRAQKREATCIVALLRLYRANHTAPGRSPRVHLWAIMVIR